MKSILLYSTLSLLLWAIAPNTYSQQSEKYTAGESSLQYDVNSENEIDANYKLFPQETGELIVVSAEGYRVNLFKYDEHLNLIKEEKIHIYQSADIKGTVVSTKDFAHILDGKIFIKVKYSPIGTKDQFELFRIYDLDLKSVSDWIKLGETTKTKTNQLAISDFITARNRLEKLGRLHFNDSRIVSVSLNDDNINAHDLRAFNSDGTSAYEKTIVFENESEDLFISSIELLEDGSLIYIYQHLGKGIYYKLIDPDGEMLEGKFPLPEKFILLENMSNPTEIDQFVLFGVDKDVRPRLFLYSFSGINDADIHEFEIPEIENQYASSWELNITEDQKLYFSGISWKGSFADGHRTTKNLNYFTAQFDLKNATQKGNSCSINLEDSPFNAAKSDKNEVGANSRSKVEFLFEEEGEVYFMLQNYNIVYSGSPYESFTYDKTQYRTIKVNIKDESAMIYPFNLRGYSNDDEDIIKYRLRKQKKGDYKYHIEKVHFTKNKEEVDKVIKLSHKFSKKEYSNIMTSELESGKRVAYVYNRVKERGQVVLARIAL